MTQPATGDPCRRQRCNGHLVVYTSRTTDDGSWRQRYFRCSVCGATADRCAVVKIEPSTNPIGPSTAIYRGVDAPGYLGGMETNPPQLDADDWESLTLWESGMFCGLDPLSLLAMAEDGEFPLPSSKWPLRWCERDLHAWYAANVQPKDSTNG